MRLLTPAIKYWICKSAPGFLYEAMECLGGNGYVEEGILARHYREAPVNAIWEGSGNVMCLDVLRALSREAGSRHGGAARPRAAKPRACRAQPTRWRSSARRSAEADANAWRGWRSRSWRCWPPQRRSTRSRRTMPNYSQPPGLPGITAACTAPSISPPTISAGCCDARCRDAFNLKAQLMDTLEPASPIAAAACAGHAEPASAAIWKFWGTAFWGFVVFAAMFVGQFAVVAWFLLRQKRPDRSGDLCRCGPDRRRQRPDDFALRDHGVAGRSRGVVGRDPDQARAVCRLPGAALVLVEQCGDRRRRAVRAGHGVGCAVAGDRDARSSPDSWAMC